MTTKPDPPVVSRPPILPFHDGAGTEHFDDKRFENICKEVILSRSEVESANLNRYGGVEQYGVDILIRLVDGNTIAAECKYWKDRPDPKKLRNVIEKFVGRRLYQEKKIRVFGLMTSTPLDGRQEELEALRTEFANSHELEIYWEGREALSREIIPQRSILSTHWGPYWVRMFHPDATPIASYEPQAPALRKSHYNGADRASDDQAKHQEFWFRNLKPVDGGSALRAHLEGVADRDPNGLDSTCLTMLNVLPVSSLVDSIVASISGVLEIGELEVACFKATVSELEESGDVEAAGHVVLVVQDWFPPGDIGDVMAHIRAVFVNAKSVAVAARYSDESNELPLGEPGVRWFRWGRPALGRKAPYEALLPDALGTRQGDVLNMLRVPELDLAFADVCHGIVEAANVDLGDLTDTERWMHMFLAFDQLALALDAGSESETTRLARLVGECVADFLNEGGVNELKASFLTDKWMALEPSKASLAGIRACLIGRHLAESPDGPASRELVKRLRRERRIPTRHASPKVGLDVFRLSMLRAASLSGSHSLGRLTDAIVNKDLGLALEMFSLSDGNIDTGSVLGGLLRFEADHDVAVRLEDLLRPTRTRRLQVQPEMMVRKPNYALINRLLSRKGDWNVMCVGVLGCATVDVRVSGTEAHEAVRSSRQQAIPEEIRRNLQTLGAETRSGVVPTEYGSISTRVLNTRDLANIFPSNFSMGARRLAQVGERPVPLSWLVANLIALECGGRIALGAELEQAFGTEAVQEQTFESSEFDDWEGGSMAWNRSEWHVDDETGSSGVLAGAAAGKQLLPTLLQIRRSPDPLHTPGRNQTELTETVAPDSSGLGYLRLAFDE